MKKPLMIKMLIAALLIGLIIPASGCSARIGTTSARTSKKVPPGQAKKAAGEKSAKRFAPGQNK